jgi:membrane protease YdiL (CAAX protease family)
VGVQDRRWPSALAIAALATSAGASTCALGPEAAASRAEEIAIQGIGFELFLGLAALAGAALWPGPVRERLGLRPGRLPARTLALLVLGAVGLSHALDAVIDLFRLGEQGSLAELEAAVRGIRGRAFWLALLGLGIAPGISEELFCRGLVQRGLSPSLGAPAAVALASLLFAALHADPVHAAFAGVLGLYLGIVCHLAASVRPAIVCHAANNLCALLASAFAPDLWLPAAVSIGLGAGLAGLALSRAWRVPPASQASRSAGSAVARQLGPTDGGRIGRL